MQITKEQKKTLASRGLVARPSVYVLGRQAVDEYELAQFLQDEGVCRAAKS